MEWTLFIAAFILGYLTCKAFYFYNAARTSLTALKATQVAALAIITKALEDFYNAKIYRMQKMIESDESDHNINALSYLMEEEISYYKKKAVQNLIDAHPKFFKQLIEFEDWESAMAFLQTHKEFAAGFLMRSKDD